MRQAIYIIIGLFTLSCQDPENKCTRGKFLNYYCEGVVVKVLEDSDIGVYWSHPMWSSYVHENVVIANIDSTLNIDIESFTEMIDEDSVVYFEYLEGGYPSKQYMACDPSPFITITRITADPMCED